VNFYNLHRVHMYALAQGPNWNLPLFAFILLQQHTEAVDNHVGVHCWVLCDGAQQRSARPSAQQACCVRALVAP
jgi:hypothetical protein